MSKAGQGIFLIVMFGVLLFVSLMSTIIVSMAIWPGEVALTAPLLCDDARPDAYVVRDTYNVRPGETSMTFTMYCVGPRGDYDEIGTFQPFLVLWAAHTMILAAVALLGIAFVRLRSGRRAVTTV